MYEKLIKSLMEFGEHSITEQYPVSFSSKIVHNAADIIIQLHEQNKELRSMCSEAVMKLVDEVARHKWIDVNDRLPEDRIHVLVYCDECGVAVGFFNSCGNLWKVDGLCYGKTEITHWMPLPEPPKEV